METLSFVIPSTEKRHAHLSVFRFLSTLMFTPRSTLLFSEVSRVDPRLLLDCDGNTPFAMARRRHHFDLLPLLNPLTSFDRSGGVG